MGGLPTFLGVFVIGLNRSLVLFLKKKPSCEGFLPLALIPSRGAQGKASWFPGYPKTQLAGSKTRKGFDA